MNNNELIIKLISMLGNQNSNSESLLPWQKQIISQATVLPPNTIQAQNNLINWAKTLSSIVVMGDVDKAEYFCFLPVTGKKWKVFLVDRFNNVLARMEDYEDEINQAGGGRYSQVFLLKII